VSFVATEIRRLHSDLGPYFRTGIAAGFHLERILLPGRLTVVSGAAGCGKTTFAANVAANAAESGTPVLYVAAGSVGMEVAYHADRLLEGRTLCAAWKVADVRRPTVDDLRDGVMDFVASAGTAQSPLVIIDSMHDLSPAYRAETGERETAEVARALKALAKELSCALVVIAEINRKHSEREDSRPLLEDLRGSGVIENCADAVAFVHRLEPAYSESTKRWEHGGEIIIAKARFARTGTAHLSFEGGRFTLAEDPY
jgi:replicative DNA helicase